MALQSVGCSATPEEDAVESANEALNAKLPVQAFFAEPALNGTDSGLEDKLVKLIGLASRDSEIRASYFKFAREDVATALIQASKERNVKVRLVVNEPGYFGRNNEDNDDVNEAANVTALRDMLDRLRREIGDDAVTVCHVGDGSCLGTHINHNKFIIFSKLDDGSNNVVVQSSANLGSRRLHNNMVLFRNAPGLYDDYAAYFHDLTHATPHGAVLHGPGATTGYASPYSGPDPILAALDQVKCEAGASRIRVAMTFWHDDRVEIANRLVALQAKGCDVRLALRREGAGTQPGIAKALSDGNVPVGYYRQDASSNIHSKYLLIDSPYGADGTTRKLVFTGSHNYTNAALRTNDEMLLLVDDEHVFSRFMANWDVIRQSCLPADGQAPVAREGAGPILPNASPAQKRAAATVYRAYNESTKDHLLGPAAGEGAPAWRPEGAAFHIWSSPLPANDLPLYRCRYDAAKHFLSNDAGCEGRTNEGQLGHVSSAPLPGAIPIVRCFKNGDHLTTTNAAECTSNGFTVEVAQGYVM
jgi:phosphatidylserine/phosphatidylglycerophosphate/cardiolipin synthase-like enzyme